MARLGTWLRRLRTLLWTALALVIIGAAVLVGVGKLLMPYSERFKPRLEAVLAEQFNQPVRVDAFTGEWKAFGPRISLEGVNLLGGAGGEDALAIQQAALDIKPLNALIRGRPLYSFRIIGADLELVRHEDGRLVLSGLGLSGRQVGEQGGAGLSSLARVGEVRLQDSRFSFLDEARDMQWHLAAIEGRLQMRGERLALEVRASIAGAGGARVLGDLSATVLADLDDQEQLREVNFHVETGELMMHELAAQLPEHKLKPASGRLNAQLWGSWAPGSPQEMAGVVDIRDAGLDTGGKRLLLDHLNARLDWRWRDKTQWRIDLADVRVQENGRDWTAPRISVERNLEGNLGVWVSADHLQAEFPLEVTQVIMGELGRRWPKAAPTAGRGPVYDFDLVINGNRKLTATSGHFEDLEVLEWGKWPLADGLDGRIDLAYGEGSLHVSGEQVSIRWPGNFTAPLVADLPGCEVEILWDETDHWQVDALPCSILSEPLAGEARLRFVRDEGKPRVDVNARLDRAELSALHDYWPRSVMSEKVTDWLRRGVTGGTAGPARFVMQGDMDRFPFRDGSGVVLAEATIAGATLAYAEDWPAARQLDARLRFEGPSLAVVGQIGDLAGATVEFAQARIDDLQSPILSLDYRSQATLPELKAFLQASPMLDDSELDPAQYDLQGPALTEGTLRVPFGDAVGELAVEGTVSVTGGRFTEQLSGLRLEAIDGTLAYARDGLRAEQLEAMLDGWPATLGLQAAWDTPRPFHATLEGHFPASLLAAKIPVRDDPLLAGVNGATDWTIGLEVTRPEAEAPSEIWLSLDSRLSGVGLDLPAPLDKPAAVEWPLSVRYPLKSVAPVVRAELDDLALALELGEAAPTGAADGPRDPADDSTRASSEPGLADDPVAVNRVAQPANATGAALVPRRGILTLDGSAATLPPPGELRVGGTVANLDLDGWVRLAVDYAAVMRHPGELTWHTAALRANRLILLNRAFDDVALEMGYDGQVLSGSFDGAAIAGEMRYLSNEDGSHSLSAQMDRLYLGAPLDSGVTMDTDPTALPELHFFARELRYLGLDLGETRIEAYPIADGLRIETVDAASSQLTFQARGDWVAQDGGSRSDFDMVLTSESLGAIVTALDLSSVLEGGQTMVRYDAWWPGPPAAFALARLNGEMSFSVIDGRILNADPGAGRVLGLMSVGALPRRLALDFSDVFDSGFGFDQANGTIRLDSGTAYTDDFVMESTAAQLVITGSSDLDAKEFDYLMSVRPGVSQALPVLGAIAAGPAGAAAGLALQELLRDALGGAAEARYEITGPWSDPAVERLPAAPLVDPDPSTAQAQTTEGT